MIEKINWALDKVSWTAAFSIPIIPIIFWAVLACSPNLPSPNPAESVGKEARKQAHKMPTMMKDETYAEEAFRYATCVNELIPKGRGHTYPHMITRAIADGEVTLEDYERVYDALGCPEFMGEPFLEPGR